MPRFACDHCGGTARPTETTQDDGSVVMELVCRNDPAHRWPIQTLTAEGARIRAELARLRAAGNPDPVRYAALHARFTDEATRHPQAGAK